MRRRNRISFALNSRNKMCPMWHQNNHKVSITIGEGLISREVTGGKLKHHKITQKYP
jgi:hypothetical protein